MPYKNIEDRRAAQRRHYRENKEYYIKKAAKWKKENPEADKEHSKTANMNELIVMNKADLLNSIEQIVNAKTEHLETLINSQLNGKNEVVEYLTRKETAKMLKVSLVTLYDWYKKELLIPHYIGKKVLYKYQDIINFVENI